MEDIMRKLLIAVALAFLALAFAGAAGAAEKKKSDTPTEHSKPIANAAQLPKEVPIGETLHVEKKMRKDLFDLLGADVPASASGQCSVECDKEVGAITCAVGQQCTCGCIAGYARCECRN
jgi:hypothetical protein